MQKYFRMHLISERLTKHPLPQRGRGCNMKLRMIVRHLTVQNENIDSLSG